MRKPNRDIDILKGLLDKYKFVQPIPQDVQKYAYTVKKDVLIKVLKTVGKYTIFSGFLLSIYFLLKKIGIYLSLTKMVVSVATIVTVTTGTYYSVVYVKKYIQEKRIVEDQIVDKKEDLTKKSRTLQDIKNEFNRIDEITLYNGRIIKGAIISRGRMYKIMTTSGIIFIPKNDIHKVQIVK